MALDLKLFFSEFSKLTYCIIKLDDKFPNYIKGSDVDIFSYDIEALAKIIIEIGQNYIDKGLEIAITNLEQQIYIDFLCSESKEIEFRFDLYAALPDYKNLLIKDAFFENVLENRVPVECREFVQVFVPSSIDENILRYIEYQEWYGVRPDKIKHIDYILNSIPKGLEGDFLEKLHHYTKLPLPKSKYPLDNGYRFLDGFSIKACVYNYLRKLWRYLPQKIKYFIKNILL